MILILIQQRVKIEVGFNLGFKKYNSQISIVHSIDTLPNSTSLYSKDPNPKQPVWYDQFAIFVTRGYANIYHNAEWIMNFIHIVNNIADFPLVYALSFFH